MNGIVRFPTVHTPLGIHVDIFIYAPGATRVRIPKRVNGRSDALEMAYLAIFAYICTALFMFFNNGMFSAATFSSTLAAVSPPTTAFTWP